MPTPEHVPSWPEVCAVIARWQQANWPGIVTAKVLFKLNDGRVLSQPMVSQCQPLPSADPATAEPADDYQPFVPTPFQKAILAALEGKAMRTAALGAAVGDKSRLYKPGGIQELRERGLVELHERLGFYRPDAPPAEISETDESL